MKKKLLEENDPNEKVDDFLLNKKIGLDGEKMALYRKIMDWLETIEDSREYIAQLSYDDRYDKITATLQQKKGPKYLILHHKFKGNVFEIGYYSYEDGTDSLEKVESEKTNSPSNIDYLLKKYKNFLMEKQQITEAREKTFTEAQIDQLIRNATTSIHKLKEAVGSHLDGGKFMNQLDTIYKVLQDTPSLATLKKQMAQDKAQREMQKADKLRASVQEDIKIDAKSDPNTVRKAEELAKKNNTDIELTTESMSVGQLKRLLEEAKSSNKKQYNSKLMVESFLSESHEDLHEWWKEQCVNYSDEYSQFIDYDSIKHSEDGESGGWSLDWKLVIPFMHFKGLSATEVEDILKKELTHRSNVSAGARYDKCSVVSVDRVKGNFIVELSATGGYDV